MSDKEQCKFCAGEYILADGPGGNGTTNPMRVMLYAAFGGFAGEPDGYGVQLDEEGYMHINNSCGEHNDALVKVEYCPFCGRNVSNGKVEAN